MRRVGKLCVPNLREEAQINKLAYNSVLHIYHLEAQL